jgi:hypothetical protein
MSPEGKFHCSCTFGTLSCGSGSKFCDFDSYLGNNMGTNLLNSRRLLDQGKVKVRRPSINKYGKGFEGVLKGMDAMRHGKVSGEKLVFTV